MGGVKILTTGERVVKILLFLLILKNRGENEWITQKNLELVEMLNLFPDVYKDEELDMDDIPF